MDREALKQEIKEHLIEYLNLVDMKPEDIADDEPLFGEGLGLDSIDSIEMVVMIEREYGLKINNATQGRKVLVDVNHIVDYIIENKQEA